MLLCAYVRESTTKEVPSSLNLIFLDETDNAYNSLLFLWEYIPLSEQLFLLHTGVLAWLFYADNTLTPSSFRPFIQQGNTCYESTRMSSTINDAQVSQIVSTYKTAKKTPKICSP